MSDHDDRFDGMFFTLAQQHPGGIVDVIQIQINSYLKILKIDQILFRFWTHFLVF